MYQPIELKPRLLQQEIYWQVAFATGFLLILLVLTCFALSPLAQGQIPNIFAADNPSGSLSSGGANIAYLQNTTGSDVH